MQGQSDHEHGLGARLRDVDAPRPSRVSFDREDDLVQQLVVAKYALSIGRDNDAMEALDCALAIARQALNDLLPAAEPDTAPAYPSRGLGAGTYAGRLVRDTPAALPSPAVNIADRRGLGRQLPSLPRQTG